MSEGSSEWDVIVIEFDEGNKIYRLRNEIPSDIVKDDFTTCVIIEWLYEGEMPGKELNASMMQLEEALEPLENGPDHLMVHSITGCGMREWCYYSKNYDAFMEELNNLLEGKPRFPINILGDVDAKWKYFTQIKAYADKPAGNG